MSPVRALGLVVIVGMVLIFSGLALTGFIAGGAESRNWDCLDGAEFFGSYACPACQRQKMVLGEGIDHVAYIECDGNGPNGQPDYCLARGIQKLPTWIINGDKYVGFKSLEELSEITSCQI